MKRIQKNLFVVRLRFIPRWVFALALCAFCRSQAAYAGGPISGNTVTGDLTVTPDAAASPAQAGNLDVQGATISLGSPSGLATPGFRFNYIDGATVDLDQLQFVSGRPDASWIWLYTTSGGTLKPQMWLDGSNILTICDRSTNPQVGIQLNPSGPSAFYYDIVGYGGSNRLPNQSLQDDTSVVTRGLGDQRYIQNGYSGIVLSGNSVALPGGQAYGEGSFAGVWATANGGYSVANAAYAYAGGDYSVASGIYSSASGMYSTASGLHSVASGDHSTASGNYAVASGQYASALGFVSSAVGLGASAFGTTSRADGSYSTALGVGSTAAGMYSMAVGYQSIAIGDGSMATGWYSDADGQLSTAAGAWTSTQGYGQFVVGANNLVQGSPNSHALTDDLFQIGNGGISGLWPVNAPSNAFAVKWNGDTSVFGANFNFGLVAGQTPGTDASTGASVSYADGTAGAVTFSARKAASTWQWQNNAGTTAQPQMKIDGGNVVTIYNTSGAAAIVLDPAHPLNTSNVLTQSAADARYLSVAGGMVTGSLSGGAADFSGSVTIDGSLTVQGAPVALLDASTGGFDYPSPWWSSPLVDTSGFLYYSGGQGILADNAANLCYGNGVGYLTDGTGAIYYGNASGGNWWGNNTPGNQVFGSMLSDNLGNLYYSYNGGFGFQNHGTTLADNYGNLYYASGAVLADAAGGLYSNLPAGTVLVSGGAGQPVSALSGAQNASLNGTLTVTKLVVSHIDPQGDISMGEFTTGE